MGDWVSGSGAEQRGTEQEQYRNDWREFGLELFRTDYPNLHLGFSPTNTVGTRRPLKHTHRSRKGERARQFSLGRRSNSKRQRERSTESKRVGERGGQ